MKTSPPKGWESECLLALEMNVCYRSCLTSRLDYVTNDIVRFCVYENASIFYLPCVLSKYVSKIKFLLPPLPPIRNCSRPNLAPLAVARTEFYIVHSCCYAHIRRNYSVLCHYLQVWVQRVDILPNVVHADSVSILIGNLFCMYVHCKWWHRMLSPLNKIKIKLTDEFISCVYLLCEHLGGYCCLNVVSITLYAQRLDLYEVNKRRALVHNIRRTKHYPDKWRYYHIVKSVHCVCISTHWTFVFRVV